MSKKNNKSKLNNSQNNRSQANNNNNSNNNLAHDCNKENCSCTKNNKANEL